MENDQKPSPYDPAIADVRAKIKRLENTLLVLEELKRGGLGGIGDIASPGGQSGGQSPAPSIGPGAFFGMTIVDAAKKLLHSQQRQMTTSEIVPELERGGIVLTSADKVNTVGSILLRRFQNQGDIVRVSRGLWGLQEWYPGRKFPGGRNSKQEEQKADDFTPLMESAGNEERTEPDKPTAGLAPWLGPNQGEEIDDSEAP